jgi:hypothetical protein
MIEINAAKHVAGEKRAVNGLKAVRPAALGLILWEKCVQPFTAEAKRYPFLEVGLDSNGEPWEPFRLGCWLSCGKG